MIYQGDCLDILPTLEPKAIQCCVTSPPYYGLRDYGCAGQIGLESTPEAYVEKMVAVFREVHRVLADDGTLWLNLGDSYSTPKEGNTEIYKNPNLVTSSFKKKCPANLKPKNLIGIPWRVAFALQQPYYTGKIRNEVDRVWLASMIDGEGCMFIHKRKAGQSNGQGYERKSDSYGAGLEVANTHESIVQRCLEITGMGSICRVERETKNKHRNIPLYRWNMRSNQCRDIIREIYPYLVGKQHEARLILGCPSSGPDAEKAHYSLMALHNAREATIDFPAPKSLYEPGWYLRQDCIWSKANPMPESVTDRCTKSHEYIFLLTKSARYYYDNEAVKEDAVTFENRPHGVVRDILYNYNSKTNNHPEAYLKNIKGNISQRGVTRTTEGLNLKTQAEKTKENRNKRSVWSVTTQPYKEAHFATFPEEIPRTCILAGSKKGDTILDPFSGAGTTGVVAEKLNRKYIGIELNPQYTKMAEDRIYNVQPLFAGLEL